MKLKIAYDNRAKKGFKSGWGFACIIEINQEKLLFDTGWDVNILISNMKKLEVKEKDIDRLILSHSHWDHIGGLTHFLRPEIEVYLPKSFSEHLKDELNDRVNLHEVDEPENITSGVWTTGELQNKIEEQSLALETDGGIISVTGCSHPGVPKILSKSSKFGELRGIIGGFHGFEEFEALEGLEIIGPTHCTKNREKIRELFPSRFLDAKTGTTLKVE
ncbi:MAG: MBL fold metallo-hydrolase [Candidatus Hadarchaeota archaeon]